MAVGLGMLLPGSRLPSAEPEPAGPGSGSAAASASQALLSSGKIVAGQLLNISAAGAVSLDRSGERITLAADELVRWGAFPAAARLPLIVLTDGSLLHSRVLSVDARHVRVAGTYWSQLNLPRKSVRGIIWHLPPGQGARDRFIDRISTSQQTTSELWLRNGDRLEGALVPTVRPDPGAFFVSRLPWRAAGSGTVTTLPLDRVQAVVFAAGDGRDPVSATRPRWALGLGDSSRLVVAGLQASAETLEIALVSGVQVRTDPDPAGGSPWKPVVAWQSFEPHVQYLSDSPVAGYQYLPFLQSSWPWHADRNVRGGWLRVADRSSLKGVGMHGGSRLVFQLDGRYQAFHAELAIDASAGWQGSVVCRVLLQDPAGAWRLVHQSPVIRSGQPPLPVRVALQSARRLALVVDVADYGDQWDHLNWLDARLVQPSMPAVPDR